jgi:hypothetical protein
MSNRHGSAVVVGASIGGLLAARALSAHFNQITIVERDRLPEEPVVRKGVPQSAHAHGLLASGYRVMDGYFPGLMDELEARGAPRGMARRVAAWLSDVRHGVSRRDLPRRHGVGIPLRRSDGPKDRHVPCESIAREGLIVRPALGQPLAHRQRSGRSGHFAEEEARRRQPPLRRMSRHFPRAFARWKG